MSKTSEAKKFIKEIDDKVGEYWSDSDVELAHYITMFSDQQSSSKDARIKELEVQISGKTFFDEKETMAAKIQELEARLETAEKVIKRTDTWLKGRGKDFQEDIEYEIKKYQTQNKTE